MPIIAPSAETTTCVECRAQVASRDCDLTARGPTCARCVAARASADALAAYGTGGSIAERGAAVWIWGAALVLIVVAGLVLAIAASGVIPPWVGLVLSPLTLFLAVRQWLRARRRRIEVFGRT